MGFLQFFQSNEEVQRRYENIVFCEYICIIFGIFSFGGAGPFVACTCLFFSLFPYFLNIKLHFIIQHGLRLQMIIFRLSEKHTKFEKNLPHGFDKSTDLLSKRQNHEEDLFKLCVLLKNSELYSQK